MFTARRPFSLDFRLFQLGTDPFPLIPTQPESLYTPNDAKAGPGTRRPCETPHRCGPLREVFSCAFLVHTTRRRWRTSRPPRPRRGERLDPDTQDLARPEGPPSAAHAPLPSSRRRVQKCPFHVGLLHTGAVWPGYKNVRFRYGTCTPPPEPARKSKCSQFTSGRGPIPPVSKPFQLWKSLETGGGTKMYASPNPCTPQRHRGGCRRRRDLKDPSRMKAPAGPVLKDRSWVNSLTGGYAGGPDCSHSQTALAKGPAAENHGEANDLTRTLKTRPGPKTPRQSLVLASTPTGKNATFERGTCHSGALGPVANMPLPATDYATPVWKMPASLGVHSRGPVEGDFPPFQLRNSHEIPDRQKCRWSQIPVHPKGIAQGVSNTGACRPPHMIPLTGGYAGGLGGSHSLVEIAGRRFPNRMRGGTRR